MRVVSWNVNSIRARAERLWRWLDANAPDVVCLQELKVTSDTFPFAELQQRGYHAAVHGQRAYNGVAILSRQPITDITAGFGDDEDDGQARLIAGTVGGVRILSVYVPNGSHVGSEKYLYKLAWMQRLRQYLQAHHQPSELLLVCGDLNVAPNESDVAKPEQWRGTVLFHPEVRQALSQVQSWGLVDVFHKHHPEGGIYSWWDYRMLGFVKNNGLRIDHILATPPLAECSVAARIDREERKGTQPSDHAPVIAEFRL